MEKLNLEDFTRYKFLSALKYSPHGNKLFFLLHEMDVEENKYLSNIHMYDFEKDTTVKITSSNSASSFFFEDEDTLIFSDVREEKDKKRKEKGEDFTSYYRISLNGGEAEKYIEIPTNVTEIERINENTFLLTGLFDNNKPDITNMSDDEKEKALKKWQEEKDYQVLDEIPFWLNGQGYTNKIRNRLYIYNIKEKKLTPITDPFTQVHSFKLNEDKTKAVLITNSFTDKMHIKSDLYIYHIEENHLEKITHQDVFSYSFADFIEDDQILFIGNDMAHYGINEKDKI